MLAEGLLTVTGVAVGVPCAVAVGRLARSLLFDQQPWDPFTVAAAALGFIVICALAGLWRAHRASTVDPMAALRAE